MNNATIATQVVNGKKSFVVSFPNSDSVARFATRAAAENACFQAGISFVVVK